MGRKVVLGSHPLAPTYWDFCPRDKLGIPHTSHHCVLHPLNDRLKLGNPGEHHIALFLLWPHGSPNPLNVQPLWLSGVTAFMPAQWIPPITPPHPLSLYFPVPLNHPRVLPWTHSLSDLPSLLEYVDLRYLSRQCMRLLSRWITRWATDGWEWHGARDKSPHTSSPILQVTTNEPQTPGTGHKKMKIRHLPMDKLNPPPRHQVPWPTGTPAGNCPNSQYPQEHGGQPRYPHIP